MAQSSVGRQRGETTEIPRDLEMRVTLVIVAVTAVSMASGLRHKTEDLVESYFRHR